MSHFQAKTSYIQETIPMETQVENPTSPGHKTTSRQCFLSTQTGSLGLLTLGFRFYQSSAPPLARYSYSSLLGPNLQTS
jgi:hypothetical protein